MDSSDGRDDFPQKVKETLAKRAGQICSNPTCNRGTSGPHSDDSKSVSIGVAAHITAAAPNGPRYNSSLTPEERSSIGNGIWLCQSCSKLIDSDTDNFREELLHIWKRNRETVAKRSLVMTTSKRSKGKLTILETNVNYTADHKACIVGFNVCNPSSQVIEVKCVEFIALETFRKLLFGGAEFSRTYDLDISKLKNYKDRARCRVDFILEPGETDSFAIVLSALELGALAKAWRLRPRIVTTNHVQILKDIQVFLPPGNRDQDIDTFKNPLREGVELYIKKFPQIPIRKIAIWMPTVRCGVKVRVMLDTIYLYSGPSNFLSRARLGFTSFFLM